ncbi:MAG: alanine racemase [Pseudomonadota bacterium]
MARPTQAQLNLAALRHNVRLVRERAPAAKLMAVVKADAYGHGAVTISNALSNLVDALAVACMEEAIELRDAGIDTPILLLEGVFDEGELPLAAARKLWITVENRQQLQWLERTSLSNPIQCWLKVDTGMNRLGVPRDAWRDYYERLCELPQANGRPVLFTHLSSADNINSDATERQLSRFLSLDCDGPRSICNSAGVIAWPQAHFDWVRPGYMLYGYSPMRNATDVCRQLRPVMSLTSSIISVREVEAGESVGYDGLWVAPRHSRIATVAVGYGDGYPRHAPTGTPVLIEGQLAPLVGRVSMDMITVDITELSHVDMGSPVTLWGEGLRLEDIARRAGTIGYELTSRIPSRTPRVISAD